MTFISLRRARAGLLLFILPAVVHCTTPAPATRTAPAPSAAPRPVAPAPAGQPSMSTLDGNGKPVLFNDPPAPPDTPLCGRQAREINAIGATLQGARVAASGICSSFACYDPLTATYIGMDGYRHVCR